MQMHLLQALGWAAVFLVAAGSQPARATESISVRDCAGVLHRPFELGGHKAAVLIFISAECPISNSLAPEINRIVAAYTNFSFYLVHADPDIKADSARQHARDFRLQAPVLLDPAHGLVKAAGATMTPEAVVCSAEGKVLYRGRINDLFAALGKKRAQSTRHDLRDALEAIGTGRAVANSETKVVGCYIPGT